MIDLANAHKPITNLFRDDGWDNYHRLSDDQVEFFNSNGYLAGIKILDEFQLETLRLQLSDLMSTERSYDPRFYEFHLNEATDSEKVLFHALGAWRVSKAFHDLIFHQAFTVPATQLLGGPVRFWHDQLFVKPAKHGGIVAWHQDYSYWTRTSPMAHLTCWIGLDDSTAENGCIQYVPGSHRWDLLPRGSLADDMNSVFDRLNGEQREKFKPVAVELKAGQASFHHPKTIHGSLENISNKPRRATVINVFRDGVISNSNEPLLEGVPVIPKGEKIAGRFFPLIG